MRLAIAAEGHPLLRTMRVRVLWKAAAMGSTWTKFSAFSLGSPTKVDSVNPFVFHLDPSPHLPSFCDTDRQNPQSIKPRDNVKKKANQRISGAGAEDGVLFALGRQFPLSISLIPK